MARSKLASTTNTNYMIELPKTGKTTVMSLDPGSRNFACVIMEVHTENGKITKIVLLSAYKLVNTIYDTKDNLLEKQRLFSEEIRVLINKYQPTFLVLERFLSRGRGGASTAEATNISIGSILEIARAKCKIIKSTSTVLAVTWKARTKRMFKYKFSKPKKESKKDTCLTELYRNNPKNPHVFDAFMIGVYFLDAYNYVNNPKHLTALLHGGLVSGQK